MATYTKVSGTWKALPDSQVKSSGTWKHATSIHAKKSSAWQKVWDYYYWYSEAPGACNASCSTGPNGTQPINVYCKDANGNTVDDSYCSHTPKPATSQPCSVSCTYQWNYGSYAGCDAPCNSASPSGNNTRPVWCSVVGSGVTVGDGYCNAGTRPSSSYACTISCRSRCVTASTYVSGYGYTSPVMGLWFMNTNPSCTITTGWTYSVTWNIYGNEYWYGYVKQGTTTQCAVQNLTNWPYSSPYNNVMGSFVGYTGCSSGTYTAFTFYYRTDQINWTT